MFTGITHLTLLVLNQDEALAFYTQKLGFKVHTDEPFGNNSRWLTLQIPGQEIELALMPAENAQDKALVGKQGGQYPFFCVATKDCKTDYEALSKRGVAFTSAPKEEPWGVSASFKDLYGNVIYMSQSKS